MAEKANKEVKKYPSKPIAKLSPVCKPKIELEGDMDEKHHKEMSKLREADTNLEAFKKEIEERKRDLELHQEDLVGHRRELDEHIRVMEELEEDLKWCARELDGRLTEFEERKREFEERQREFEERKREFERHKREVEERKRELEGLEREYEGLERGSLKYIRQCIESGNLPSQKRLDEMCNNYGKKSLEITILCKAICEHIKSKHAGILDVWAAYTIRHPHRIFFVVNVKNKLEPCLKKLISYECVKQCDNEISSEGLKVIKQLTSASEGFDEESCQKLQSCISKHSEELMKKHKYLSIISVCSHRSKGFGYSWELEQNKCIVLYVQKKSYIPIDEEPFETSYDGIPVDVREGVFIPFGRTAGEKLDPVRMGCQIGGDSFRGTLGCFIDHPQYGVCGLTCAHVLLHSLKLNRLKSLGMVKWPLHDMSTDVYQPDDNQSVLGNVVQLICKTGSSNTCGIDVALFRITDRQPKTASLPDATEISGSSFQTINYDSCRVCDTGLLNLTQYRVVKFGSKTELRDGKIKFGAMGVKVLESYQLTSGCATITLLNQVEVENCTPGLPFADRGDSGALVFAVDNNSQQTCIGIVEGGTTHGTVVVTPIVPILDELNVPGLKSFENETTLSHIHDNIINLQGEMQTVRQDIQNINRNLQDMRSSIQDVQTQSSTIQRIEQLLLNRR